MEVIYKNGNVSKMNIKTKKTVYKWDIIWRNVIILGILHLCAIYGFIIKILYSNLRLQLFGKVIGLLSGLGVTAGAHRLWAHKTYKANTFLQIVLACMMSMTYQQSIYLWVRDHRLHHKFSETDADPHNAKRGFFFSHVGWLLIRKLPDIKENGKLIDMSDLEANPVVMFQHKYYNWIVFFFAFSLTAFFPVFFFGDEFYLTFFSATIYRYIMTLHFTWSINSVAHLYGTKPYDKTIGPTDNSVLKTCTYGEGYHNYHHTFPHDYKAAEFGGDARNITTILIDTFAWLGWATDRQTASREAIENVVKRKGDGTHNSYFNNIKNIFLGIIFFWIV